MFLCDAFFPLTLYFWASSMLKHVAVFVHIHCSRALHRAPTPQCICPTLLSIHNWVTSRFLLSGTLFYEPSCVSLLVHM